MTLFYLLIITIITLIFNIIIWGSINVDTREVSLPFSFSEEVKREIVEAQNEKTLQQIGFSLLWLDAMVIILGGIGSYLLAKKTLEPLERAHELQSQFVSDVSHELRTPLAAMQLEAEILLKDSSAKKSDLREGLESTLEEVHSLSSLTQMLLKLSQLDKKIENTTINLNEAVESRLSKFPKKTIDFHATKIFLAQANATAVDEIVTILIDNALKYRTSEAPIQVKIFREHRRVVLEVTNASEEITKEVLEKMFDRFYREDRARSQNARLDGHGLGLSIAKRLAEMMNAELYVRNEKLSTGEFETTFGISFNFGR